MSETSDSTPASQRVAPRDVARLAVIGTGWWATEFHIPALLEYDQAELVAIADTDEPRLVAAARHFGIDRTYPTIESLIAAEALDGIIVSTTSATHFAVARQALLAGLNVLVEKPMTLGSTEAWQLVRLAEDRGLHLTVGYTYQHTAAANAIRTIITGGRIGDILNVAGVFSSSVDSYLRGHPEEYRQKRKFRVTTPQSDTYDTLANGGGQTYAQTTHPAAMLLYATNLRMRNVSAYLHSAGLAVDLAGAAAFSFDNGGTGTLSSIGNLPFGASKHQQICYYGTAGYALHDLVEGSLDVMYFNGHTEQVRVADASEAYPQRAPAHHLSDLITGRATVNRADGKIGARAVEFAEAVHASAAEGHPVSIPAIGAVSSSANGTPSNDSEVLGG